MIHSTAGSGQSDWVGREECRGSSDEWERQRKHEEKNHGSCLMRSCFLRFAFHRGAADRKNLPYRFPGSSTASGSAVLVDAFRQELSKLGWIEGKNITIEYRFAEQKSERLPELAADLVRRKVDLIVTTGGRHRRWQPRKRPHRPHRDGGRWGPVGSGWLPSRAARRQCHRLQSLSTELNTKRLEVLKDAVPKLAEWDFCDRRECIRPLNSRHRGQSRRH